MRNTFKKTTLSLALATGLIGSAVWSTDSHACAVEPYLGTVCIMATPNGYGSFSNTYIPTMGQLLPLNQYQALAAIVGTTWGGDMRTTIGVPDLRGRVVVGSGTSPLTNTSYVAGQKSGSETVSLNFAQLPQHNHTLVGATVDISKMTATTTLSGLSARVTGAAALKASSGGNLGTDPTGKALATTGGTTRIYSDAAPTISMNASGIDVSGLSVGNFSGSATTTLGGTAGVSGATANAGSSAPVSLMQPYLVMNYYIATNGVFPTRD